MFRARPTRSRKPVSVVDGEPGGHRARGPQQGDRVPGRADLGERGAEEDLLALLTTEVGGGVLDLLAVDHLGVVP